MTSQTEEKLTRLIEERTGINTIAINSPNVDEFISLRVSLNGISESGYPELLSRNPVELQELIDFITINETYFFREEKVFRFIQEDLIPRFASEIKTLRVWSAGCSTGEEALSLYSLLLNSLPEEKFRIYAGDINDHVLDQFREGKYRQGSLRNDGQSFHHLLDRVALTKTESGEITIDPGVISRIDIRNINLYHDSFDTLPGMDLVLLRNILIYMKRPNKQTIIDKIVKKMNIGGILITSASEVPHISHPQLKVECRDGYFYLIKEDPRALNRDRLSSMLKETTGALNPAVPDLSSAVSTSSPARPAAPAPLTAAFEAGDTLKNVPKEPDEKEFCLLVSDLLNNRFCAEETSPVYSAAEQIVVILYSIDSGETEKARQMFLGLTPCDFPGSVYHFIGGFIHFQLAETEEALQYFRSSLKANPRFWPARYYSLSGGQDSTRQQIAQTRVLVDEIDQYIRQNRTEYQFLLEGFNARYFLEICRARLLKLEQEVLHGHR